MEAKELQLNDLVRVGEMTVKVTSLKEYTINGQPATMFHEIPLTAEILEANGLYFGRTSNEEDMASATGKPIGYGPRWCYDDGDVEITVTFPNESDGGMVNIYNLRDKYMQFLFEETIYVHELQRALRLCGLNELADGFKVE